MRTICFLIFWTFALRLPGQTNAPIRLALISESDDASAVVDVLTANLSSKTNLQLLERNEIEKVYREQGLSAGSRDYLKLGQILGADGLLLLGTVKNGDIQSLDVRLVAVKPGVVLTAEKFSWPLTNLTEWSPAFAQHLELFLPKLAVLVKDAIPISVVNLRSSGPSVAVEQELKLLTIQRLSLEPRLFVLERQKMNLLSEEKELKLDDSAFWDGSYLLDGVVDQNGYSKDTITINARLTPPKGGAPVLIEASGSRTNLTEVVNQLAAKIDEALKINSTVKEWNASDEATQYFEEAKWATKWGVYSEAEAAADSAWALGKQDLDCAMVRVNAYLLELSKEVAGIRLEKSGITSGADANGNPLGPTPSDSEVLSIIKELKTEHPLGRVGKITGRPGSKSFDFVYLDEPPNPKNIDRALHALELYYEFSRTSPDGEPKILSRGNGWHDWHTSDWYRLGIDDLGAASRVLQNFNFVPKSQEPVADKLAELRALARSVAELISRSPSVHDSYFVGDRVVIQEELASTVGNYGGNNPNIFSCEVNWGCFWQETPEDCVALYRELMSSPAFCYVHEDLWFRPLQRPRLVAWTENDRKRLAAVWDDFLRETGVSTNVFMRLEGEAMKLRDAEGENETVVAVTNFFEAFLENRYAFITNNVEVLDQNWGVNDLLAGIGGYRDEFTGSIVTLAPASDALRKICADYMSQLASKDAERQKYLADSKNAQAFEKQKAFLKENKPFDTAEFVPLFLLGFKDYSKAQAQEILPLLAAYKAGLTGTWARIGARQVDQEMANINSILNPPARNPQPPVQPQLPKPVVVVKASPPSAANNPTETMTNILTVDNFLAIPLDGLPGDQIDTNSVAMVAHHYYEGKLLVDFQYGAFIYSFDEKGTWKGSRGTTFPAVAILDPATKQWQVIACPEAGFEEDNHFYSRSVLLHGELFTSNNGQIKKYDFQSRQWQVLKISEFGNCELFSVNGHLYASNGSVIFEIMDDGKSTYILASTRRQPPVSVLDTRDLGTPTLFEGPGHSLRVSTKDKIFTWVGSDWHEDYPAPPATFSPVIFQDGILFRQGGGIIEPDGLYSLSILLKEAAAPELYLWQKAPPVAGFHPPTENAVRPSKPLWVNPKGLSIANLPAAIRQSDLYLLVDHSETKDIINEQQHEIVGRKMLAKEGYHSEVLCFSRDLNRPQKLYLNFDAPDGCPPVAGTNPNIVETPPAWMLFATNFLFFGLEKPDSFPPDTSQRPDIGYKIGVWLMPLGKIDPVLARQKQAMLEDRERNPWDVSDPDKREALLDNAAFIESQLDTIDANHNGWLDLEELGYFDANDNEILDSKEQAGINIALHLLAEKLLKQSDTNSDGTLDRVEFNNMMRSGAADGRRPAPGFIISLPDENRDGQIDLAELETFLKQVTFSNLQPPSMSGTPRPMRRFANNADLQRSFKEAVESFWGNPGGSADGPPVNSRIPFGSSPASNGISTEAKP